MRTGNTVRQKPRSVPKKENLGVLLVKSILLRIIYPAFVALGLVQDGYLSDVKLSGRWSPGGLVTSCDLDNGCQVVWIHEPFRGIIRGLSGRSGVCPDICAGIDTRL